jgi:branched-chain amino acid transport system substrate-binding protein
MLLEEIFDLSRFATTGGEPLRIGLASNVAPHTRELCGGVYLALQDAGALDGVRRQPVQMVWQDDRREAAAAAAAAQAFEAMGIAVVIGHLSASAAVPAAAVYQRHRSLLLAPGTTHPALTERGYDTVFRVCARDDRQAEAIADWVASEPAWRGDLLLIEQDIEHGAMLAGLIADALQRRGRAAARMTIPREGPYPAATWRQLQVSPPRLILFAGIHEAAAEVIRGTRAAGYAASFLLGDDSYTPELPALAGAAAEGARGLALGDLGGAGNPRVDAVVARYRQLTGQDIGAYLLTSYAAASILRQAIEAAGSAHPEALAPLLRSRRWDTPLGRIGFHANGDAAAIEWRPWQVHNGSFVPAAMGRSLPVKTIARAGAGTA